MPLSNLPNFSKRKFELWFRGEKGITNGAQLAKGDKGLYLSNNNNNNNKFSGEILICKL